MRSVSRISYHQSAGRGRPTPTHVMTALRVRVQHHLAGTRLAREGARGSGLRGMVRIVGVNPVVKVSVLKRGVRVVVELREVRVEEYDVVLLEGLSRRPLVVLCGTVSPRGSKTPLAGLHTSCHKVSDTRCQDNHWARGLYYLPGLERRPEGRCCCWPQTLWRGHVCVW